MNRVRFEYNATLITLTEDVINGAFKEAVQFTEVLDKVMNTIAQLKVAEEQCNNDGFLEQSFELLDWIMDSSEKLCVDNLIDLCDYPIARTEVLTRRIVELGADIRTGSSGMTAVLAALLNSFCDSYSFPSGQDLKDFEHRVRYYLGQLGFFVYYQYQLYLVKDSVITEPVYQYCAQNGVGMQEIAKYWEELMRRYRPELTVFEEYPELESPFWDVAGSYMSEFDLFADFLTKDDVLALVYSIRWH